MKSCASFESVPHYKLVEFRARYGLSQAGAAKALGCSTPSVSNWERQKTAIPKYIGLAMAAFAAGLKPYGTE